MKSFKLSISRNRWVFGLIAGLFTLSAAAAGVRAPWSIDHAVAAQKVASPGVRTIEFDRSALDDWPLGESGQITLPSGSKFAIRAERVEEHASGNRSWVGKFEAGGLPYSVVVTYGEAGVTGEFQTPDGLVQIRGRDGQAFLIDVGASGQREALLSGPDSVGRDIEPDPALTPADGEAPVGLKATPVPQTTIDLLVVYTPGMVTRYNTVAGVVLRLNDLVAKSNQSYIDSEIAITVRLVTAVQIAYTESNSNDTPLDEMRLAQGVFNNVSTTLRTRYGADIVLLIRPFRQPDHQSCGIAYVGGFNGQGPNIGNAGQAANGFGVISDGADANGSLFFCSDVSFPHELGHIMGNMHDRGTETQGGTVALPQPGAFSYSYGYANAATFNLAQGQNQCNPGNGGTCFGTVMSYITSGRLFRFSNPLLANCNGLACGVPSANAASADTAQSMNNTRVGIASWRATKLPFKPNTQTGSGQTTPTLSPFAQPLTVVVRDQADAVVPGVTVVFSVPMAGASAVLSATTVTTDGAGQAQVTATANGTNGSYSVVATANPDFVTTTYSFTLTNGTLTPTLTVAKAGAGTGSVTGSGPSQINCGALCVSPPMPAGTPITLTATPVGGSTMTGWLGAPGCPGNTPCALTVSNNATVTATFAPNATLVPPGTFPSKIDPDLNGSSEALLDGLVVLRHLFGLTGAPLVANALAAGAPRTDPTQITTFLNNVLPQLDIDGDGRADALTDGVLYIRYLFGLRGPGLIASALSAGATRTTAPQIEAYIASIVN